MMMKKKVKVREERVHLFYYFLQELKGSTTSESDDERKVTQ